MTELLSVLTAAFVIYVLYEVFATVSQTGGNASQPAAVAQETPPEQAKPAAVSADAAPAPVETAPEAGSTAALAEAAPTPDIAEPHKVTNLRDPASGEVSPAPHSYRFAKKWIKEAMVAEGLLKKTYKNSELTEAVNTQVKEALEQFKKLPKYHA